jgi:hypothetical protein
MPFEETHFRPELIEAMHTAFVTVCKRLGLRPGSSESDILATRIVDLVAAGVRDPKILASLALREMDKPAGSQAR